MPQIMVVDDDKLIGVLLATMLESMDFTVCAVEMTQAGAVAAALRLRPDLMIVDARLGSGSGLAAIAEIETHFMVPHIIMSGDRPHGRMGRAVTLMKPFTMVQLAAAIKAALGT